jgi:ribonucleoside-diphosphate reductase alpha chain
MFLDDSACNLASLNLVTFVDLGGSTPQFRVSEFLHAVRVLVVAQEILVGLSGYPTRAIAANSRDYRPIGLGYANLGGALMRQGLPYDSEAGRQWAAEVTALMGGEAYRVSAEMAATDLGAFPGFAINREPMLNVLRMHTEAAEALASKSPARREVASAALFAWREAERLGQQSGFRNSQVTVLAPTGTIALMMDCDTTGIEPDYALVKHKRLAGGGELRIVNQSVRQALQSCGLSLPQIEASVNRLEQGDLPSQLCDEGLLPKLAVHVLACANEITAQGHLRMMAAVQGFLSGAISKTVNMPMDSTVEDVVEVFLLARRLELKAVAIYRNHSKGTQVLSQATGSPVSVPQVKASSIEPAKDETGKWSPACGECGGETLIAGSCWVCSRCGHSVACS